MGLGLKFNKRELPSPLRFTRIIAALARDLRLASYSLWPSQNEDIEKSSELENCQKSHFAPKKLRDLFATNLVRANLDGCPRYFRGTTGDNLRGATSDTELQSTYGRSSRDHVEQIAW